MTKRRAGRAERARFPMATVESIWARDKGLCHLCGNKVGLRQASRDHVVPSSHEGDRHPGNYRLAHVHCNVARGDLPVALAYIAIRDWHEKHPGALINVMQCVGVLRAALKRYRAETGATYGEVRRQATIEHRARYGFGPGWKPTTT